MTDAIALSSPLVSGERYRIRFFGNHGQTGGAISTDLLVGVSTSATDFGVQVGSTGLLPASPVAITISFVAPSTASYITMMNDLDGDLSWAMIDGVVLELDEPAS